MWCYLLWNVAEPRYVIQRHETEGSNELLSVVSQTETIEILGSGSAEVVCSGTSHCPWVCNCNVAIFTISSWTAMFWRCSTIFRNVANCLPNATSWRHRKLECLAAVWWEPEISHYSLVLPLPATQSEYSNYWQPEISHNSIDLPLPATQSVSCIFWEPEISHYSIVLPLPATQSVSCIFWEAEISHYSLVLPLPATQSVSCFFWEPEISHYSPCLYQRHKVYLVSCERSTYSKSK
jgi:hypothetical protein